MKLKSLSGVFVLLLVTVLLTGCGGSSSLVDKATTGSIVFYLTKGEEQPISALSTSPEPTHIRVRISHANGYRVIRDIAVPQTETVEIPVPAVNGYRIDAFSYVRNWARISYNDYHLLLKHDTELGINVAPNSTTMVQLVLEPFAPEMTLPSEVVANEPFAITISNIPDFMYPYAYVKLQTTAFTNNFGSIVEGEGFRLQTKSGLLLSGTNSLNAPDSEVEGDMYVQSTIFLHDTMLKDGEHGFHFRHWYPNIDLGEPQISVPLKLPEGGIGIGIVY